MMMPRRSTGGGVAQLGEHFHGMEGVMGSSPIASTISQFFREFSCKPARIWSSKKSCF